MSSSSFTCLNFDKYISIYISITIQYLKNFYLILPSKTIPLPLPPHSRPVTRSTSVPQTFRCMPTTIARTQRSCRKDSSGSGQPKTVARRCVCSTDSARRTSTASARSATTHSRIRLTWVRAGIESQKITSSVVIERNCLISRFISIS